MNWLMIIAGIIAGILLALCAVLAWIGSARVQLEMEDEV